MTLLSLLKKYKGMQVKKDIVKDYYCAICPYCRSIETTDGWTLATFKICAKKDEDQTYKCFKCKKTGNLQTFVNDLKFNFNTGKIVIENE